MAAKKKVETKTDKGLTNKQVVGIGVGITAAIAAAAGGFFLYGSKNAAKNRKTVKSWGLRAKAEVLEGIEKAQNMTKEEYEQLVGSVVATYQTAKSASKNELSEFKKEMNDHWSLLVKTATPKKVAKKAVKKAPVKVAPKKK